MTMAGIMMVREDGSLVDLNEAPYTSEGVLQQLLAQHPRLLSGDDAGPRRWLLITREMGVPANEENGDRWSLDHLFLDDEGVPTLVEVKRSDDTRIRREVVGQMLDYAANAVVRWPVERVQAAFNERCARAGVAPSEELAAILGPGQTADDFWQEVKTNLQAHRVRLVIVADVIPAELRRVIEFLNEQMDPVEVLGVEVKQYVGEGNVRSLVTRVIGRTEEAIDRKGVRAGELRQWDEASFFGVLKDRGDDMSARIARRLLEWSKQHMSYIWWGKNRGTPSFVPVLRLEGNDDYYPINLQLSKTPALWFGFKHMYTRPFDTPEGRRPLAARIGEVPGVHVDEDWVTRHPNVPLTVLAAEGALEKLISVLDWSVEQVRRA